jgi:sugar phosphate isomerase/epimerase
MKLIVFSKMLKEQSVTELIQTAHDLGIDGYDLCIRPGYAINPDNISNELVRTANNFHNEGLSIPMVTGNFDLLTPDHPTAELLLSQMDQANIRLIKLGYYKFDPATQNYMSEVDRIKRIFSSWERLGEKYQVKVCYHVHSDRCMGLNCAALAHLIGECDPRYIGGYIDPGHMVIEGEEFAVGAAMVEKHLSIVGLKDVMLTRQWKQNHGSVRAEFVPAGEGMVDWTEVFRVLQSSSFDGPLSIHCEHEEDPAKMVDALRKEVAFFRPKLYS